MHMMPGGEMIQTVKRNYSYLAFNHYRVDSNVGFVPGVNSCPFERVGDIVTITVSVHNISAGANLTVELQGSFDGSIWFSLGNFVQSTTGYGFLTVSNVQQILLRYAAFIDGPAFSCEYTGYIVTGED